MKKITLLTLLVIFLFGKNAAQTFTPIASTGYNLDAIAENTTAISTTGSAIDGSDYVLYSAAYGAIYNVTTGLPNNGLIASGTRTYQLQPYTGNNMLHVVTTATDSITFTSPAAYSGISLLCFATEGIGVMDVTLRFTDNTTQVFSGQSVPDWFTTGNTVISGFDRAGRTTGTPNNSSGNPKMYSLDFNLNCANRLKNLQRVIIRNTGGNARNCIMAVSGAVMPTFTATGSPVTCSGGTNGGALITVTGGIGPYTYSFATTPPQNSSAAGNLAVGVYSYTAMDAALCPVNGTVAVTLSLAPQPPINVTTNYTAVCAGLPVSLNASGAATYTWAVNNSNASQLTYTVNATTTFSISGYSSANCFLTGSINILANPVPTIAFNLPSSTCINSPNIPLVATPQGGNFSGLGASAGVFNPVVAGVGTKTISYYYMSPNNCSSASVVTVVVHAVPVVGFTASPLPLCINSAPLTLTANPNGGVYAGTGVSGTTFSAGTLGASTSTISYTYTDANNCSVTKISAISVNPLPVVTITTSKKSFCLNSPSLFLNGQPSGGVYSGPGISNISFMPATAGVGTHTVNYSYTDGNNCTAVAAITMTVGTCTGIEEFTTNTSLFSVYPNPSNGAFTVKSVSDINLTLVNELGQLVKILKLESSNNFQLTIENIAAGIYFVKGQNDSQTINQKIIVSQ